MSLLVSINGLVQVPGVDYHYTEKTIAFSVPPMSGSVIDIRGMHGVLARIAGDGRTFVFEFLSDFGIGQFKVLEDAFKLRHVPAVADMLERLQVVVELAKQE